MVNIKKCAVIGCGFVGASTGFSLVQSGVFSEIVLIDVDKRKAEGEAMDISHCISFKSPVKVTAGDYCDLKDCSLIIITAGANQKPGETRLDLVKKNTMITKSIVSQIIKFNTEGILLVVSNPVDIMTYVTLKVSGFPANRVFGSGTVLDTARLKYLLGRHFNIDSRSVHAFIMGEHGDSELAVWSSANISGIDLDGFCKSTGFKYDKKVLDNIYKDVVGSAYEIISRKGVTNYGIAAGVDKIARCIVNDVHAVLPVSVFTDGHYGLNDICIGIPSIVGRSGVEKVLDIPLDEDEKSKLLESAKTLKEVISGLEI